MSWPWFSQLVAAVDPGPHYLLSLSDVFLLLFIMIGPVKSIAPFATATAGLALPELRKVAWKVFLLSLATVLVAGLLGGHILQKWHVNPAVLQAAGGLVFLLVALQMVLAQYHPPAAAAAPPAAPPSVANLVHPVTLPAYGIAALITIVAASASFDRTLAVLGVAVVVLLLDLLVMCFVRQVLQGVGRLVLQILGAVLGMLQVALALQLIVAALRMAQVLH